MFATKWRSVDGNRRTSVGFALQILQRRLASTPAEIHCSLEGRRKRLEERLRETCKADAEDGFSKADVGVVRDNTRQLELNLTPPSSNESR
jgi:hypothetical protein